MSKSKLITAESQEELAKLAAEVREIRKEEQIDVWFQRTFSSYSKCVELNAPFAERMSRGRHRKPHIWSPFPSPAYYGEPAMTPEQLTDACQIIRTQISKGEKGCMEINLIDKTQNNTFGFPVPLKSILIDGKYFGKTKRCGFYLREDERMDANILAGNLNDQNQLFLAAKWVNGKEFIFELEEFKMISSLFKFEDIEIGIFTVFDKKMDVMETALFEKYPKDITLLKCAYDKANEQDTTDEMDSVLI